MKKEKSLRRLVASAGKKREEKLVGAVWKGSGVGASRGEQFRACREAKKGSFKGGKEARRGCRLKKRLAMRGGASASGKRSCWSA